MPAWKKPCDHPRRSNRRQSGRRPGSPKIGLTEENEDMKLMTAKQLTCNALADDQLRIAVQALTDRDFESNSDQANQSVTRFNGLELAAIGAIWRGLV